jgi:hypothetical protein
MRRKASDWPLCPLNPGGNGGETRRTPEAASPTAAGAGTAGTPLGSTARGTYASGKPPSRTPGPSLTLPRCPDLATPGLRQHWQARQLVAQATVLVHVLGKHPVIIGPSELAPLLGRDRSLELHQLLDLLLPHPGCIQGMPCCRWWPHGDLSPYPWLVRVPLIR